MKAEGLKNEDELQSYFVKRIERFVVEQGPADHRLDRDRRGRIGARRHRAVVARAAPRRHCRQRGARRRHVDEQICYLNYRGLAIEKCYAFEPTPPGLSAEVARAHPRRGALPLGLSAAPARRAGLSAAVCVRGGGLVTEERPRLGRFQDPARRAWEASRRTGDQLPPRPGDLVQTLEMS